MSVPLPPVPWCLAWSENGELAPQDRFDLLQTLVACERASAQPALIAAVERLASSEMTLLASGDVTGLCS